MEVRMNDIVINWSIVTTASVLLGFIINQALAYFDITVSGPVRKAVVFGVAVALSGYVAVSGGYDLPDPAVDPSVYALALLSLATSAFKAAQLIYDKLWSALVAA